MRMERLQWAAIAALCLLLGLFGGLFIGGTRDADLYGWPVYTTTTTNPLSARVAALEAKVKDLDARVAALERTTTTTAPSTTTTSSTTTTTAPSTTTTAPVTTTSSTTTTTKPPTTTTTLPPTTTTTAPPTTTTTLPPTTTTLPPTTTTTVPSALVSVAAYGANGGDGANDTQAIQAAMDSTMPGQANAGKTVYFPAGTYLVSSYLYLKDGMKLTGDGAVSVLSGTASGRILYGWNGCENISITNLKFTGERTWTDGSDTGTDGIYLYTGSGTVSGCTFEKLHYGLKLESANDVDPTHDLTVSDCMFTKCVEPLQMSETEQCIFRDLVIQAPKYSTNQWHGIYVCHDTNDCTFSNISISGGSGYCLQLWTDAGSMNRLTFTNIGLDASSGRYALVIGHDVNNVTFNGLVMKGGPSGGHLVTWYGGQNVTLTGVTAIGNGAADVLGGSGDTPVSCSMSGTYSGCALGSRSGVTTSGMVRQ